MKAGGAFMALCMFRPVKHIKTIVQDVRATVVLTDTDVAGLFDAIVDSWIDLWSFQQLKIQQQVLLMIVYL